MGSSGSSLQNQRKAVGVADRVARLRYDGYHDKRGKHCREQAYLKRTSPITTSARQNNLKDAEASRNVKSNILKACAS